MNLVLTCPTCTGATRLPASYLLLAVMRPAADSGAAGTAAWICRSCARFVVNSVDWPALAALVGGGAELVGGFQPAAVPPHDRLPGRPSPRPRRSPRHE
jgi:hypothetical protein